MSERYEVFEDPWAPIAVPEGQSVVREFGPLQLTISHGRGQWWLERDRDGLEVPASPRPPERPDRVRFVAEDDVDALVPTPALADRSIVARPEDPLSVVARSQVTLIVSTPLWVVLHTEGGRKVTEVPTILLKDTWFGPDTRNGELCYAARTAAKQFSPDVSRSPLRAYTRVRIRNDSNKPFDVRRVKIPTPLLALYSDEEGGFYTPDLEVHHEGGEDLSAQTASIVHARRRDARLLAPARAGNDRGLFASLGRMLG